MNRITLKIWSRQKTYFSHKVNWDIIWYSKVYFSDKMDENDYQKLSWADYKKNVVDMIKNLKDDPEFYDCTIICNDKKIQAHRYCLVC